MIDDHGRPHGWLAVGELRDERVPDAAQVGAIVEMDDILRDALSDLLTSEARYGVVVDDKGVIQGVLSIEVISRFLHEAPTDSRSGADLVEDTAA